MVGEEGMAGTGVEVGIVAVAETGDEECIEDVMAPHLDLGECSTNLLIHASSLLDPCRFVLNLGPHNH